MREDEDYVEYGQIAYDAYCLESGGKSLISGATLPDWMSLKYPIRAAWVAAAQAVAKTVRSDFTDDCN